MTRSSSPKAILVTGGTGLIGSYIIKLLVARGDRVRALKRETSIIPTELVQSGNLKWVNGDITDPPSLVEAFNGIDCVIHSAALISFDPRDFDKMLEINVEGTSNMVNLGLKHKTPRFIFVSSIASLGRGGENQIVDEQTRWTKTPENSKYSESKYLAELEVWRGHEEGLNMSIVNPSTVLGPGDWSRSSTQLFWYAWRERKYFPSGFLNYVDLRDIANMTLRVMDEPNTAGSRYVANGGHIDFKTFFEMVCERLGKRPPYKSVDPAMAKWLIPIERVRSFMTGRPPMITAETLRNSSSRKIFDSSKIKSAFGLNFTPLKDTLDWTCSSLLEKHNSNTLNYEPAV